MTEFERNWEWDRRQKQSIAWQVPENGEGKKTHKETEDFRARGHGPEALEKGAALHRNEEKNGKSFDTTMTLKRGNWCQVPQPCCPDMGPLRWAFWPRTPPHHSMCSAAAWNGSHLTHQSKYLMESVVLPSMALPLAPTGWLVWVWKREVLLVQKEKECDCGDEQKQLSQTSISGWPTGWYQDVQIM